MIRAISNAGGGMRCWPMQILFLLQVLFSYSESIHQDIPRTKNESAHYGSHSTQIKDRSTNIQRSSDDVALQKY